MLSRHLRAARRDEEGIAMIMAMLIMLICTVVVTASLALAVHSNTQSSTQRNLTAAQHAADYGLQEELANLAAQPSANTCTPIPGRLLPNTSLPAEWFSVTLSGCTANALGGTMTILATGYALGEGTTPTTSVGTTTVPAAAVSRTEVAHVTLQPAGALSNGGYGFPDAILSFGSLSASSGAPLTVSDSAGPESIRADGAVTLSGGQLTTSSVSSWNNITLTNNPVTGNVAAKNIVTLNSSNVSGYVDGSTVNLGSPPSSVGSYRQGTETLPVQPPAPIFTYNPTDWGINFTGDSSPTTSCPAAGGNLSGLYVLTASCTLAPATLSTGPIAVILNTNATASLTVTLPQFPGPGPTQLYLIVPNGNNLTLTDQGAATQVFAYGSGTLTVAGTIVGQLVGGNVATSLPTNLIAESVSTTVGTTPTFPPDFAFPAAAAGPTPAGFVPQIINQYMCPAGTTTSC